MFLCGVHLSGSYSVEVSEKFIFPDDSEQDLVAVGSGSVYRSSDLNQ